MINCILLVLLLLVSIVLLKCTIFSLVIYFLNFVRLSDLQVLLITILPVFFVIFSHLQFLIITHSKILFILFLKLTLFRMGFFWTAYGWWVGGGGLPKIFHTYPAMIKLGRVIPYPKKIQKVYESRDRIFEFC